MEGGSSKKEQSAGTERGKIQKLTAVDIGRQYLDSMKEIGKELRRFWVRISVTILMEQKRHRLLYIHTHIYIHIYDLHFFKVHDIKICRRQERDSRYY